MVWINIILYGVKLKCLPKNKFLIAKNCTILQYNISKSTLLYFQKKQCKNINIENINAIKVNAKLNRFLVFKIIIIS